MSEALKKLIELRRLSTQGEWMLSNSNEGQIHSPLWEVATDSYYNPKDEDEPCLQLEINCGTMQDGIFISEAANSIEQIGKDYDSAQKKIEAQEIELKNRKDEAAAYYQGIGQLNNIWLEHGCIKNTNSCQICRIYESVHRVVDEAILNTQEDSK